MFILQNAPLDDLRLPGVRLEEIDVEAGTSMFDMTFKLRERGGLLEGELEFNTDLFDGAHDRPAHRSLSINPGRDECRSGRRGFAAADY